MAVGCFTLVFSAGFFVLARRLPTINPYGAANAGFWPSVLCVILFGLSLIMIAGATVKGQSVPEQKDEEDREAVNTNRLVLCAGSLLVWPVLMMITGFLISSFLAFGFLNYVFGERRKTFLVIIPLLVTIGVYVVFIQLVSIPFPRGMGVFWDFSLLFY